MLRVNLMIGDRERPAADGRTFERIDPITGEVASEAAAATIPDAIAAAEAASRAFPTWSRIGPSERRAKLLAAADVLAARAEDFAEAMIAEIGASPAWCEFNVRVASALLREAAAATSELTGEVTPTDRPDILAMTMREPAGVVLGIAPWNAPVALGVRAIAMPLACGNTVILKASELCPATHRLIGTALRDAGLAEGVVNVVTNAPADAGKVVETLISHPAVRRISFTGSTRIGRLVAETAARYLKPIVLALGGKASLVVLDDADIDGAVRAAVFGAFANQGQLCVSTERIIVDESIAVEFLQKFADKARALPAGDPRAGDVVLGSLVNRDAVTRVRSLIDDALAKGETLITGGTVDGTVMTATVLDRITPTMRIYSEEAFGPVATILRAKDVDDAVRLANDVDHAPAAAVFGRDVTRALAVARRIDADACHVNSTTVHEDTQLHPGGRAAIDAFTERRLVTIASGPQSYPF